MKDRTRMADMGRMCNPDLKGSGKGSLGKEDPPVYKRWRNEYFRLRGRDQKLGGK